MSLLMDALRRAEDAKRQAGESRVESGTASELTLAPLTPGRAAASPLPELSQHLESVDAELSAVAGDPPLNRPAGAPATGQRETVERAARQASPGATPARRGRWPVLALLAVAALGIGVYFWWQLQSLAGGVHPAPVTAPPPVTAPVTAAVTAPATASGTTPAQTATPLAAAPRPPAAAAAPDLAPSATPRPATLPPEPPPAPRAAAPDAPRFESAARPPRPSPAASRQAAPDSALRLQRSAPGQTVESAYDALQAGRLDEAQRAYEQVLRGDPRNTDALLGLATIASRQGQAERAQALYLRALEADPNDATAQAGLINSRGQADPGAAESRIKTALASQPESSALHFALGNLYARQARWSEAQQAYFRAYAGEPDNADIIFNLAVSLDQLRQNRLAAQYYRMALDSVRAHSFDRNQVKQRILELQQ